MTALPLIPDAASAARLREAMAANPDASEVPLEPCRCPECGGTGAIDVNRCTCGAGPGSYAGMHERYCGLEPCPAGCEFKPPASAAT